MDEFDVMRGLQGLTPEERKRVLAWAKDLDVSPTEPPAYERTGATPRGQEARDASSDSWAKQRQSIAKGFKGKGGTERRLLSLMSPRRKYRPAALARRLKKSSNYVSTLLNDLHRRGLVIKISRGLYQKPPTK